jgi:hypothetical protein
LSVPTLPALNPHVKQKSEKRGKIPDAAADRKNLVGIAVVVSVDIHAGIAALDFNGFAAGVRAAGSKTGLGSPVNPQPGRLRYVAQASTPAGFGSVQLPFLVAVSRCARQRVAEGVGFEPTFSVFFMFSLLLIIAFLCANLPAKIQAFPS